MTYWRLHWHAGVLSVAGSVAGMTLATTGAMAQSETPAGRIIFLGWTEGKDHSVWLSGVDPGEFFVVFPEIGERVDSWTQPDTGLHLTVSPIVRENGGTHNLFAHIRTEYAEYDNFVDSADQHPGGINFPDHWNRPDPELPDLITPELRPNPDTVTPGLRPLPDTVTPGLRPNPDLITPGLRPLPETVTPELRPNPDTVTPGLRPDPDTVTPGLRPNPDTVTPGLRPDPDTVTPGLRPDPDTVTPGLRPGPDVGGPTVRPLQRPRPETLPPIAPTGIAPGRDERRPMLMTADEVCRAGREGRLRGDPQLVEKACRIAANARRRWTAWGEWSYSTLKDDRSGARTRGSANQYNIGLDRWIDKRTVAGLAIQFGNSDYESFNGGMRQQADSITVKPYMVHRMADSDVVLDASIGFNFGEYEQHVLMLSGKHDSFTLSGTIGMSAQRPLGSFLLRPRLSWSYASIWHDNYVLQGQVGGIDLRVLQGDARYDYGAVATSLEISRPFRSDDMVITPYVEGGVDFAYLRPNGGRILGPDLRLIATTPAVGSVRFGTRIQLRGNVALIGSGEYYGIGSGGLSSWQWRANLSFRF